MSFWLVIYCNWWILLKFHIENVPRQLQYFLLCYSATHSHQSTILFKNTNF